MSGNVDLREETDHVNVCRSLDVQITKASVAQSHVVQPHSGIRLLKQGVSHEMVLFKR